jgi:SAM-dependent methyltransferase
MDQFSSAFAQHWDELVGWSKRANAEMIFLTTLLRKFRCASVLDVALGTGFHSIELIKRGFSVTGVDVSPAMISVARQNAIDHGVELNAICSDWIELRNKVPGTYDCVLCLGNSLACETDGYKRQQSVLMWKEMLSKNGVILVDRRNYEALLADEYNFNAPGQYFGESVKIDAEKVSDRESTFSYTFADGNTFSLDMYPLTNSELLMIFEEAGLTLVEMYGDRKLADQNKEIGFYLAVFKEAFDE